MRKRLLMIALMSALGMGQAQAGDFLELKLTGGLDVGANNPNVDKFYLDAQSITGSGGNFTSIRYNAIATSGSLPRDVIGSGTLNLLDLRVTRDVTFDSVAVGDVYDYVFRDTRDNKLVFGTRVQLGVRPSQAQDAEINFLYRAGFYESVTGTTFSAAAAWLFTSDFDLRLYNAGRTASTTLTGATPYDRNVVRFQSDVNVSEGNPFSGLFLIKTNAPYYRVAEGAVGLFQAGEEGQPRIGASLTGFVAAIPEPGTYALLLGGLGLVGFAARRRQRAA